MLFHILFFLIAFASLSFDIYSWMRKNITKEIRPVYISLIAKLVSLSLIAYIYFLTLLSGISFWVVLLLLMVFVSFLNRKNKLSWNEIKRDLSTIDFRSLLFFWVLIWAAFPLILKHITYSGRWDAWAIWLPHAKFLASDNWDLFFRFTPQMGAHPDYPLMLPGWIAMGWKISNTTGQVVPLVVEAVVFIFVLLLVFVTQKKYWAGLITVYLLAFSDIFLKWAFSGYADTLLALYFTSAVTSYYVFKNYSAKLMWIVGFLAASSGWVKNEGLLFFVLMSLFLTIKFFKQKDFSRFKYFVLGSIIPLSVIILFKSIIVSSNDLVSGWHQTFTQLFDWKRYGIIFNFLYDTLLNFYRPLLILLVLLIFLRRYRFFKSLGFKVIGSLLLGYILIYAMSPAGLEWHLRTSADRLFLQIYPVFLFVGIKYLTGKSD